MCACAIYACALAARLGVSHSEWREPYRKRRCRRSILGGTYDVSEQHGRVCVNDRENVFVAVVFKIYRYHTRVPDQPKPVVSPSRPPVQYRYRWSRASPRPRHSTARDGVKGRRPNFQTDRRPSPRYPQACRRPSVLKSAVAATGCCATIAVTSATGPRCRRRGRFAIVPSSTMTAIWPSVTRPWADHDHCAGARDDAHSCTVVVPGGGAS